MKNNNQIILTFITQMLCNMTICAIPIVSVLSSVEAMDLITSITWVIGGLVIQNKTFKFMEWNFDISNDAIVWDEESGTFINGMDLKELV